MLRLQAFALALPLLLAACLSTKESGSLVLECARASWEAPRPTETGSLLPWLRVEQSGAGCETSEIRLLAFRDADEDGVPDAGTKLLRRSARWSSSRDATQFDEVQYEGPGPTRWVLELQTPKGEARVDLGWVR